MKKSILLIALIAMATLLGLNSCNKGDGTTDPSQNDLVAANVLPDALMPAFDASTIEVFGSIDEDINVYPEFNNDMRGDMGGMGGRMMDRMHNRMGLGFKMRGLFSHLNLTDTQKVQVHKYMLDYHDCVTGVMEATRAAREKILTDAATQRRAIIAAFKAGTDTTLNTRQKVMAALHKLNQDTRDSLQALIDQTALCNCFKTLLTDVYAVLDTDAQKTAFKTWFAKLQNQCFEAGWTPWGK